MVQRRKAVFLSWPAMVCVAFLGAPVGAQGPEVLQGMVLKQPVRIETGWARAFVQHGQPVVWRDRAKFDPYCSLEVTTVARPGMEIDVLPDDFDVTRVQHKHVPGGIIGGLLNRDDDPGPVEPEVDIYLSSEMQPTVLRVRCVRWEADAIAARRVSLEDVREAFGSMAEFR
jgi:hypothetical protein